MKSTQKEAYEAILKDLPQSRQEVLITIKTAGCLAGFQVANILGKPLHAVSGRLTELMEMGLIKDTGMRVKNPNGRNGIVWEAAA